MPLKNRGNKIVGPIPLVNLSDTEQAKFVRLCVCMNVVQTLHHLAACSTRDRNNDSFEQLVSAGHDLVTAVLLLGVLKEGADAIRDFSRDIENTLTRELDTGLDPVPAHDAWARVQHAIDKSNPQSLWNRHLKRARDDAAFHWSRLRIESVCKTHYGSNAPYVVVRKSGDPINYGRHTYADEVLGQIAFPATNARETIREIQSFGTDVIRVLATFIPSYTRYRGCTMAPLP